MTTAALGAPRIDSSPIPGSRMGHGFSGTGSVGELVTFAGAVAASVLLLVLSADLALAQSVGGAGLEPIDNAAKQLERFLRGPFAKTVMAIAIALTGYVCATGRAPWFWFGLCIIACALIFGAPKIVEFFSQGAN